MNNKNIAFLFVSFVLFLFVSCNLDNATDEWRLENQAAYDEIKADSNWKELNTEDGPSGIFYRDLTEPGTEIGSEHPIQTAEVVVNYTGRFHNDNIFDSGIKSTFAVNGVVRGFGTALQHMRVGQKWDVCIPYFLGYGAAGSYPIKPYSTLFFEIELLQITQHPK